MQTFSRRCSQRFWLALTFSATTFAQDATFRASTELVVVDALVEHKKTGIPIKSLTRDDFEIYEDKVLQPITQFSLDTVPLSIVFLFDMTDSVRPVLKPLANGALDALHHLKSDDEIAVMLYSNRAELTQDFTTNHAAVAQAINGASQMARGDCGPRPTLCAGEAFFNEGVFQAATRAHKASNASNRPVIIWLTDNVPNIPNDRVHSEAAAIGLLRETGVVVCTLMEKSAMSHTFEVGYSKNPMFAPFRMSHPPGDVHKYAEESGGIVIGARREEIGSKLADLIDRLRSRYTIGYRPVTEKAAGTLCKIDLKLKPEAIKREGNVVIRARRAYKR